MRLVGLLACAGQGGVESLVATLHEISFACSLFSDVHSYVFCHAQASLRHRHIHNGLIYIRLRAGQGPHGS